MRNFEAEMRNDPSSVMIFAAGFGARMGALTRDRPKPMIHVAGKALIDHALDCVDGFGAASVVVNLHYKPDLLRAHLADRDVIFSEEQPDILETGGGLKAALPLLGEGPVFTMNTDAVWAGPNPLRHLSELWDPEKMDALLLCVPMDRAVGHTGAGDFKMDPKGRLTYGPGLVYSGLQILKTERVDAVDADFFSLKAVWTSLEAAGRLYGTAYPGRWADVGHPAGIEQAEVMLRSYNG